MSEITESFISRRRVTLKAGVPYNEPAFGRVFYCLSGGQFKVKMNGGEYFDMEADEGINLVGANERFRELTFQSTVDQTIEFAVGNFFWQRSFRVVKEAKTKAIPWDATQIAGTTSQLFAAVRPDLGARRSVIISNLDAAVDLFVEFPDPVTAGQWIEGAVIYFRQAWTHNISSDFRLKNASASPVNCRVVEFFYFTNE